MKIKAKDLKPGEAFWTREEGLLGNYDQDKLIAREPMDGVSQAERPAKPGYGTFPIDPEETVWVRRNPVTTRIQLKDVQPGEYFWMSPGCAEQGHLSDSYQIFQVQESKYVSFAAYVDGKKHNMVGTTDVWVHRTDPKAGTRIKARALQPGEVFWTREIGLVENHDQDMLKVVSIEKGKDGSIMIERPAMPRLGVFTADPDMDVWVHRPAKEAAPAKKQGFILSFSDDMYPTDTLLVTQNAEDKLMLIHPHATVSFLMSREDEAKLLALLRSREVPQQKQGSRVVPSESGPDDFSRIVDKGKRLEMIGIAGQSYNMGVLVREGEYRPGLVFDIKGWEHMPTPLEERDLLNLLLSRVGMIAIHPSEAPQPSVQPEPNKSRTEAGRRIGLEIAFAGCAIRATEEALSQVEPTDFLRISMLHSEMSRLSYSMMVLLRLQESLPKEKQDEVSEKMKP